MVHNSYHKSCAESGSASSLVVYDAYPLEYTVVGISSPLSFTALIQSLRFIKYVSPQRGLEFLLFYR